MCDLSLETIRINLILTDCAALASPHSCRTAEDLAELCIAALRRHYDSACPDECLENKARDFAKAYVAHRVIAAHAEQSQFPGVRHDPA
jgi:hypothetical protein